MQRQELSLWLRLLFTPGIGSISAQKLLQQFGLPEQIFTQSAASLRQVVSEAQASALLREPEGFAQHEEQTWNWLGASRTHADSAAGMRRVVSLADPLYPRSLLQLPDPPALLYLTGHEAVLEGVASKTIANDIAIVGSRHATPQGLQNAKNFANHFARSGMHVVSGMALGIDGAAHQGALQARRELGASAGSTIAVVGTGLDRVYPKRHLALAHEIAEQGLILSEFPIGTPPLAENFPRRNRLIAALTQGTLVVEAAVQSGSLITARQAADMGREVFAIPGSIHNPQSRGCHALIKQGAKLVESAQDVLEELPHSIIPMPLNESLNAIDLGADPACSAGNLPQISTENKAFQAIFDALGHDPVHLEGLIARTGIDAASLQVNLLELELQGDVVRLPGGLFQRQILT